MGSPMGGGRSMAETEELLRLVATGDGTAMQRLLVRHAGRLRGAVAARMAPQLRRRLDPSDIIQEALADAGRKLPGYLRDRPLPFHAWLWRLARERLNQARRRHQGSSRRAVGREVFEGPGSAVLGRLAVDAPSPSRALIEEERRGRLLAELERAGPRDREVLVMRYREGRSFGEIAEALGVGLSAVKMRHLRALERLRERLADGADS